ncbi:MAG: type II toxin-antitoxin system ParD family antitoxin [Bacteroidales bacterium]|nr:type II toxin-antitoxin system ParD family antitoxin [Bacteroidales bacterium]
MAKNTSILIGDYFESFIKELVKSGKYASASEVVRAALRLLEIEENKAQMLVNELEAGERSGVIPSFNREITLSNLHAKYNERDPQLVSKVEKRKGWNESFREMHEKGDDHDLMPNVFDEEDNE